MKVDVQGFELHVFQGAENFLKKHPNLRIEAEHCPGIIKLAGLPIIGVPEYMDSIGYDTYNGGRLIPKDQWASIGCGDNEYKKKTVKS